MVERFSVVNSLRWRPLASLLYNRGLKYVFSKISVISGQTPPPTHTLLAVNGVVGTVLDNGWSHITYLCIILWHACSVFDALCNPVHYKSLNHDLTLCMLPTIAGSLYYNLFMYAYVHQSIPLFFLSVLRKGQYA